MTENPQFKAFREKLPGILNAMRQYHALVDRCAYFNDPDAKSQLNIKARPIWALQMQQLIQPYASESSLRGLVQAIDRLLDLSRQIVERGQSGRQPNTSAYESLMLARENIYEALSEAGPARLGGAAADMINRYRRWSEEVIYAFLYQPDEGKYESGQKQISAALMKWLDEIPLAVRSQIDISEIVEAEIAFSRIGKVRIQERAYGRVANAEGYDGLHTTRERLIEQLTQLQVMLTESDRASTTPLAIGQRRRLEADLHSEMARFQRHPDQTFCLVLCVVDRVKSIHDSLGDEAVDAVLRQLANVLISGMRPYDKLYWAGGGKIAMILPNTPIEGGFEATMRFRRKVEGLTVSLPGGRPTRVTVSFGVAEARSGDDWQALYDHSYKTLAAAKAKGSNQACAMTEVGLVYDIETETEHPPAMAENS